MKIVSEKECVKIIDKHIGSIPNVSKMSLWAYWNSIRLIICCIFLIVSFILATVTLKNYKFDIISLFGITNFNICWKSIIAIICFVIIIATITIMVIIHELLHVLCNKIFKYESVIVVNKRFTISVFHLNWAKKRNELFIIISPFIIIFITTCILHFVLNNAFFSLWITLINLAISCSDMFCFAFILLKTPSDAMIFGHYFRCQQ